MDEKQKNILFCLSKFCPIYQKQNKWIKKQNVSVTTVKDAK